MKITMPTIIFGEQVTECEQGENLRHVLLKAKLPLYNGIAAAIHCRGMGTCGTCAIDVEGSVSEITSVEKWRLSFPPHKSDSGLRLACQCKVLGDLKLKKHGGMWGNRTDASSRSSRNA